MASEFKAERLAVMTQTVSYLCRLICASARRMSFLFGTGLLFFGDAHICCCCCCSDSLIDRSRDGEHGDSAELRSPAEVIFLIAHKRKHPFEIFK